MLARGALCRLAANAPKTSTHDLPQLARLLQRSTSAHNATSLPSICALSHAYNALLAQSHRSYATAARATKPTTTVKTAVKKAAATKPATKKVAAKKPKKTVATKKRTTKRKTAKKAVAKKTKKPKKTDEEKEKALIRELRRTALKDPGSPRINTYAVYVTDKAKGSKGNVSERGKDYATAYKNLTAAEREHYNHLATEKTAERQAAFSQWVLTHTPDQIRLANNARVRLRALYKKKNISLGRTKKIPDDRLVKRPAPAFARFFGERKASGDMKSISLKESGALIANEWKALSASEKKPYVDAYEAEKKNYATEYERTYGSKP
ncbi:hypothetical protein EJ04DRAFT_508333 [Polyplosphaeria fusca]|uniref:HMG box domain-containing protein n=1 Tax=Polyplosphaeria fusca TaxID=682080 RepID=A0A9P4R5X1_9PLEO|nr:hypothetical protein EJ04DRAFT_508333 [Polyplosphaeria fusca]